MTPRTAFHRPCSGLDEEVSPVLKGKELRYVLTTAENWLGPIKTFTLKVEKPSPETLVSLRAEGIKRTGPTSFEPAAEDDSPPEHLKVCSSSP